MPSTVAFDEAGNTGQDLLNSDQPFFVLASACLGAAFSTALVSRLQSSQSKELHFKTLKDTQRGRSKILEVFQDSTINSDSAKLYAINKSFMVTTKIVDILIETVCRLDGHDILVGSENVAISNILHEVIAKKCGQQRYRYFQDTFVQMMRTRAPHKVVEFYMIASSIHEHLMRFHGEESSMFFTPIVMSQGIIGKVLTLCAKTDLDPIIPAFVRLADFWGRQLNERFDVLFDNAKTMHQEKDLLDALASKEEQDTEVGYDERTTVFPLKIQQILLVDSLSHPNIQIVDILGSATAYSLRKLQNQTMDDFSRAILSIIDKKQLVVNAIMPRSEVIPQPTGARGRDKANAAAHVAGILRRHMKRTKS